MRRPSERAYLRLAEPSLAAVDQLVQLVDPQGAPAGTRLKSVVHDDATPLHLAYSVYVFDGAGSVLMTRRALFKATWPGVWTNTCCGHPRPGERIEDAARRRLWAELGLSLDELRCVLPHFRYRARDAGGTWENEICPVYVAVLPRRTPIRADRREVMESAWCEWTQVTAAMTAAPFAFSPWAVRQVAEMPLPAELFGGHGAEPGDGRHANT